MTHDEAVKVLKKFVNNERWKWGHSWGLVSALDIAIAVLERDAEANKTIRAQAEENVVKIRGSYDAPGFEACVNAEIERLQADLFRDVTKKVQEKVQNTDSVEGIPPTDSIVNTAVESISRSDVDPFDERVADVLYFIEMEMQPFQWAVKSSNLITEMQAHIRKQNALLLEAADEIEANVENEYPKETRDNYPVTQRRYKRDMEIVNRIREEAGEKTAAQKNLAARTKEERGA